MKADVYNISGKSTGRSVDLPDAIFGVEPNAHAVYLDVKGMQANKRQGTHKAKERGEITGSTKKIKKQKGTGTARAGSIKNPLFRSGGRVFGPRPRKYTMRLNKKVKRLARMSALSSKLKDGSLRIIEDFSFDQPKTKEFAAVINSFEAKGKTLFVVAEQDQNLYLSARNIKGTNLITASSMNTLDLLSAKDVFISEGSIKVISESLSK